MWGGQVIGYRATLLCFCRVVCQHIMSRRRLVVVVVRCDTF